MRLRVFRRKILEEHFCCAFHTRRRPAAGLQPVDPWRFPNRGAERRPGPHQYAKLAEAVLVQVLPMFSNEIRTVGSRKGKSAKIGKHVGAQLGGSTAAALAALWSVRNARLAGIYQVFRAAAHKPGFGSTMVRIFGQTEFNRVIRRIEWRGTIRP